MIGDLVGIGPNVNIGDRVRLGDGVTIGPNAVIGDDVTLEDGVCVEPAAIVGKPARLGPHSRHSARTAGPVIVGAETTIGCFAVVFVHTEIGPRSAIGAYAFVRDGSVIGAETVVGQRVAVGHDVRIEDRVRIQANGVIAPGSLIESDVFIGPTLVAVDDNSIGLLDGAPSFQAPILRRGCRLGGGVVLLPGVEVGEEAFVAAASVVTRDVVSRTLVMGAPARFVRSLRASEVTTPGSPEGTGTPAPASSAPKGPPRVQAGSRPP